MKNRRAYSKGAKTIFANGLLFRNPLLIGALGMYPVIAAGYTLKNAAALSVLFLLIAVPAELTLCFTGIFIPRWSRPGAALIVSAAFYIPAAFITNKMFTGSIAELGMAAGLMVCNSAVYSRADEYAPEHIALAVAADAFGASVGFAAVICLTAAVRELWLTGGVWNAAGQKAGGGLSMPFAGFILLGFLAAFVQWINAKRTEKSVGRKA